MTYNTNTQGESFTDSTRLAVWNKARIVSGVDSAVRRLDRFGAWIDWNQYGVTTSVDGTGWEIDHHVPKAEGGSDALTNLVPLQWRNNRIKGDSWPPQVAEPVRAA